MLEKSITKKPVILSSNTQSYDQRYKLSPGVTLSHVRAPCHSLWRAWFCAFLRMQMPIVGTMVFAYVNLVAVVRHYDQVHDKVLK
jgi:hypothetical protein